jgi:hypothetical protein
VPATTPSISTAAPDAGVFTVTVAQTGSAAAANFSWLEPTRSASSTAPRSSSVFSRSPASACTKADCIRLSFTATVSP